MNIVLEGPDGAGKSTLGRALSELIGMPLIQGEGPPKSPMEFEERCVHLNTLDGVIFDRIPYISETIYSAILSRKNLVNRGLALDFFSRRRPFIVYVIPATHELPHDHSCKAHESPEHVALVAANHKAICQAYEARMLHIAHYIFRRNDRHLVSLAAAAREYFNPPVAMLKRVGAIVGGERPTLVGHQVGKPDTAELANGRDDAAPLGHLADALAEPSGRPHG